MLSSGKSWSQSPYFSPLKIDKSLQQFETHKIFQDSKGYIWFATNQGLYQHDGIETIKFGHSDGINRSPVTAIAEDKNSSIWVGHKDGSIEIFDGSSFTDFDPEEGLPMEEISFIIFDDRDVVWFGTLGEGIYYYAGVNRKRLYNLNTDEGLNDNFAYTAVLCPFGDIYVGTDNGIAVIDTATNKVKQTITMRDGLPDNIVKHLYIRGETLWIGMDEGGITLFNITTKTFQPYSSWDFGRINNFTLRSENECWVSTRNSGVVKISLSDGKPINYKQFTTQHGLLSNRTSSIYADRERNIWIGNTQAIVISTASPFEFFDQRDGFEYKKLFSFINDSKNRYWAATEKGLIRVCDNGAENIEIKRFNPPSNLAESSFISIYEDFDGFIWAGTYGYGAFRIDPESLKFKHFSIENGLPDNNIMHITGNKNTIWFSTLGGGASSYNTESNQFSNYSVEQGLGSNYVYSIYIDSKDRKYVALDGGGVSLIDGDKVTPNFIADSLGLKTIYSIVQDGNGDFWLNSAEKGLCRLSKDHFEEFKPSNDYRISNLRGITTDNDGNVVVVGNEAIQIYRTEQNAFETYAEESGVSFLDPNLNAISKDNNGNIWISTNNGLVVYNPGIALSNTELPKVIISKRMLFFEPIASGKIKFRFNQNHISFEFGGFWYQAPENIRYRYMLKNYDYDWSRPTPTPEVTYSNLPPGKYSFVLEISHKSGVWTGSENAVYSFTIRPPFWETWWFIGSAIIVIVSSIGYYIKARLSKLQKDKERLEKEVIKRTATIQLQKEEIETQRDYVIIQRDQIAKQNKDITSSIQYASRIQNALYPPIEQMKSILGDCFILLRPQDIVSGDFYWATQKDENVLLAVADCTGHGVPGAFMSVLGLSLLNKIVSEVPCCRPEEMLNRMREEIKEALRQTGKTDEAKDGMDMALVQFNRKNKILHFAGANNPAFIVRDNNLIVLKENRMPIGIYPKEREFDGQQFPIKPGDILYLFTDGYSDQFGGPSFRKFMMKNFKELLVSISNKPLEEQHEILNNTMDEWKNDNHQNDDILVIGVRF